MKKNIKYFITVLSILTLIMSIPLVNASAADTTSASGMINLPSGNLNVRSSPSTSGSVLTYLPAGSYVTLLWKTGDWWHVEYAQGRYGYASAKYIRYIYGTYAVISSSSNGSISIYNSTSNTNSIIGTIPSGQTVLVLSQSGNWYRILYNGTAVGFISTGDVRSLMAWPVPGSHRINQYFGAHEGVDIGASTRDINGVSLPGDTITAAQGGNVVYSGWLSGYGYVVYINSIYNGKPIQTRYGHLMSVPLVTVGQVIGIGQKLGYMGNTGTSSGTHLHFEVRLRYSTADCIANIQSTPVDPLNYIS